MSIYRIKTFCIRLAGRSGSTGRVPWATPFTIVTGEWKHFINCTVNKNLKLKNQIMGLSGHHLKHNKEAA